MNTVIREILDGLRKDMWSGYRSQADQIENELKHWRIRAEAAESRVTELELRLDAGTCNLADIDPPEVILLRQRVTELEAAQPNVLVLLSTGQFWMPVKSANAVCRLIEVKDDRIAELEAAIESGMDSIRDLRTAILSSIEKDDRD